MTRKELKHLFLKKISLFNSEQTLAALKESFIGSHALRDGSANEPCDLSALEEKIRCDRIAVAKQEAVAREALKLIEDDAARIGAMLHYCEGMPWNVAAAVIHYTSGNALRQSVYREMAAAGIRSDC